MKTAPSSRPRVAIVGAGVAGAACASGLADAGFEVTVYDKSQGVGGRMANRRVQTVAVDGVARSVQFDHGCRHFSAGRPRFQAVVARAVAQGRAARWRQHVYATFPAQRLQQVIVPTPDMPSFCRHLLGNLTQRLGHAVTGLEHGGSGRGDWYLRLADGADPGGRLEGPFDEVVIAIPAPQAAVLLGEHRPDWSTALAGLRMDACWTLMALTDEVDWPWDAADIEKGELAWVGRDDRKPGRPSPGAGLAAWVAHATPAWSREHLEDEPAAVAALLSAALARLLPGGQPVRWHHLAVHRWRYARPAAPVSAGVDCWWDAGLRLGVCGDAFGDGLVQSAWCSGDELADTMAAAGDVAPARGSAVAAEDESSTAESVH